MKGREKRQTQMEVENELEKTTTEEPDATEERLIFGKEEDEENDYDDVGTFIHLYIYRRSNRPHKFRFCIHRESMKTA